jgi:hypothetical protein
LGEGAVDVYCDYKSNQWYIQLKKGAMISIPRALRFDRFVAGQIPTGNIHTHLLKGPTHLC